MNTFGKTKSLDKAHIKLSWFIFIIEHWYSVSPIWRFMSCKTSTHHKDVTTISESLFICNSKYHLLKRDQMFVNEIRTNHTFSRKKTI